MNLPYYLSIAFFAFYTDMKIHKLYYCYYVLIILSILCIFYNLQLFSDEYQYVKRNTNSYLTNEILKNEPELFAFSYSRKQYLKYKEKYPNVPIQFLYEMKNNDGHQCYFTKENKTIIYNERNIKEIFNITI